jgi:hypothetical protein
MKRYLNKAQSAFHCRLVYKMLIENKFKAHMFRAFENLK